MYYQQLLLAATVCFALASATIQSAEGQSLPPSLVQELILEQGATGLGIAQDQVALSNIRKQSLELTDLNFYFAKAIDQQSPAAILVAIDLNGQPLDYLAAMAAEKMAFRKKYGRLAPLLFDRLQQMQDSETMTVALWLKAASIEIPFRPNYRKGDRKVPQQYPDPLHDDKNSTEGEYAEDPNYKEQVREVQSKNRELRKQAAEMLARQMRRIQAPALAAIAELGLKPRTVSKTAPLIYVKANKQQILILAELISVDTIYPPNKNQSESDIARPTIKGDIVDIWNYEGLGIRVGVLERERTEFANPNLPAGTTRDITGDIGDHPTAVSGFIASSHGTLQGVAQNVTLFSANSTTWDDADLSDAMDWAAGTQNLDVINNSWGGNSNSLNLNDHDRHLDFIVRNQWSTVTKSAGNNDGGCGSANGFISSPGKGWNVITVGGSDDNETEAWGNDDMYTCSSWVDPSSGADKPEVTAPGESLDGLTSSFPWTDDVGSGTSYSAPLVAGLAADIMSADSYFEIRPEVVKAAIIATALQNVEGASRLSERDGTGSVDMRAAVKLATGTTGDFDWRSVSATSFPYDIFVELEAGERIRAAIAWDSNANSGFTTDTLDADIDLRAYNPDGTFVASSVSANNAFEILDFTASTSGSYRFEISEFTFSGTSEFIGFACWTGNKVLESNTTEIHSVLPNQVTETFRIDAMSFWNAVATRPSTNDMDIRIHAGDYYDSPELGKDALATSFGGGQTIDFIAFDRNHLPGGSYYCQSTRWSGTNTYEIEHTARAADISGTNSYGPYALEPDKILWVFDANFVGGTEQSITIVPTSNAELDVFLLDSDPTDTSSQYLSRFDNVAAALSSSPGQILTITHTTTENDWLGLIIANKSSTAGSSFMIYSGDTTPTGSIQINNGISQTGSFRVSLNLAASSPATSVDEMRLRNAGQAWGAWEPYVIDPRWTIPAGAGVATVEVQYRNTLGQESTVYADSITQYACPQPAGSSIQNATFTVDSGFPWCFADSSDSGFVSYDSDEAVVEGGNDLDGDSTMTYIHQRLNGTATMELNFTWSYVSSNTPSYDFAYWDVIDLATGSSAVGGPQDLTSISGSSGTLTETFTGSGTYELRLGTRSTDNQAGSGISTFDNIIITEIVIADQFRRGDINSDGAINIADPVFLLASMFSGGPPLQCDDAGDANDDGTINIADAVAALNSLFGSPALPLPNPYPNCGPDPTLDGLNCTLDPNCP